MPRAEAAFAAADSWLGDVPARLCHGDLGNHNVFVRDGHVSALIDWEDCLAGDPVYDVAFWATFHPPRRYDALIAGYRAAGTVPEDFFRRFWLYYLRVALAKTVVRARFGLVDLPGHMPASLRIRLGLQNYEASAMGLCGRTGA